MIKTLEKLFDKLNTSNSKPVLSEHELNLAIAALLVEVATINQDFDDREWEQLQTLLISECKLSQEEALAIAEEAEKASANSASLYDFTQRINQQCDYEQKIILVEGLWKIAYADGELDKYEEHIIRRIADLIHVSHRDFIQAKIKVRDKS
ncbi:MAG: TerB family tellurite resistance protein [Cellvibrionaceae bacterium]